MQIFGPIEAGEVKAVRFDFSSEVTSSSATLSNPVVEVSVLEGTDPTPNAMKVGLPTIVGLEVVQKIQPGVPGCTYKFRCVADDSDSLRHAVAGKVTVVAP